MSKPCPAVTYELLVSTCGSRYSYYEQSDKEPQREREQYRRTVLSIDAIYALLRKDNEQLQ